MTLENCKKCPHHAEYENGRVFCKYTNNLVSLATDNNPRLGIIVLGCPLDK
jgi:hypothetical protein